MSNIEDLTDMLDKWHAEDKLAADAPVEQWHRCGELVSTLPARMVLDVAGCHSQEQFPKACAAMAAAAESDQEESAWRELALTPRPIVLHVSRALSKRSDA